MQLPLFVRDINHPFSVLVQIWQVHIWKIKMLRLFSTYFVSQVGDGSESQTFSHKYFQSWHGDAPSMYIMIRKHGNVMYVIVMIHTTKLNAPNHFNTIWMNTGVNCKITLILYIRHQSPQKYWLFLPREMAAIFVLFGSLKHHWLRFWRVLFGFYLTMYPTSCWYYHIPIAVFSATYSIYRKQ